MTENIVFMIVGGVIGLTSSLITAWFNHRLALSRRDEERRLQQMEDLRADLLRGISEYQLERDFKLTAGSDIVAETPLGSIIVNTGSGTATEFPVTRYVTLIGTSAAQCDILLGDPELAQVLLRLTCADDFYLLEDLRGDGNVKLNQEPLVRPRRVHHEDEIEVGETVTLHLLLSQEKS